MTNITLSIEDSVYVRMREHSEIKWSEFVRKMIKGWIDALDTLEEHPKKETILTMLASEHSLKKDWENEADERWNTI